MKVIDVNKDSVTKELFDDVLFFMFAEGGAMGEAGAIKIVKEDGNLYHINYLNSDTLLPKIIEFFPPISRDADGKRVPGWNYIYLGFGNHILVADRVYPHFEKCIKNNSPTEIYRDWIMHAERITTFRRIDFNDKK